LTMPKSRCRSNSLKVRPSAPSRCARPRHGPERLTTVCVRTCHGWTATFRAYLRRVAILPVDCGAGFGYRCISMYIQQLYSAFGQRAPAPLPAHTTCGAPVSSSLDRQRPWPSQRRRHRHGHRRPHCPARGRRRPGCPQAHWRGAAPTSSAAASVVFMSGRPRLTPGRQCFALPGGAAAAAVYTPAPGAPRWPRPERRPPRRGAPSAWARRQRPRPN